MASRLPVSEAAAYLEAVVHDEDVLGLDVAVEDAVAVHVVHGLHQLVHVVLQPLLPDVVPPPADELVDVHVHQLEHQGQPPRGLVAAPTQTQERLKDQQPSGRLCGGSGQDTTHQDTRPS
jgi:hypothetical protein